MSAAPAGVERLRGTARRLLWGAVACLVPAAVAWLVSALFEELVPVAGGHQPRVLAVMLVLYLAPVGVVLLALGLAACGWAWWVDRDQHELD